MDTCTIFTVNYGSMLADNARDSMLAAADRWNCGFDEITDYDPLPTLPPSCWKLDVFDETEAARVLILDADAIISERCPNPFEMEDLYLRGALGGVALTTRVDPKGAIRAYAQMEWSKLMQTPGVNPLTFNPDGYLNAGVLIASRQAHGKLFDDARALCRRIDPLAWYEQTPLNYCLLASMGQVALLDERWNYMQPQLLGDGWQDLYHQDVWIMHLAGRPEAPMWMPMIQWHGTTKESHE